MVPLLSLLWRKTTFLLFSWNGLHFFFKSYDTFYSHLLILSIFFAHVNECVVGTMEQFERTNAVLCRDFASLIPYFRWSSDRVFFAVERTRSEILVR